MLVHRATGKAGRLFVERAFAHGWTVVISKATIEALEPRIRRGYGDGIFHA